MSDIVAESGVGEVEVGTVGQGEPVGEVSAISALFFFFFCASVWCVVCVGLDVYKEVEMRLQQTRE